MSSEYGYVFVCVFVFNFSNNCFLLQFEKYSVKFATRDFKNVIKREQKKKYYQNDIHFFISWTKSF